jgi:sugar phosphate isomerase/epimerase
MNNIKLIPVFILVSVLSTCAPKSEKNMKLNYPGVKLGFSTQNFLAAMPVDVENLKEILDFAASEGFDFIELRDPSADLSEADCRVLSEYAGEKNIKVIYEIHKDLFNPEFLEVFERAVRNTAIFGEPGILRSILSWSEFASDENKKGWTAGELEQITALADSCARAAEDHEVRLILENIIEPWFGAGENKGLDDFFAATSVVGLQFDTANPFLPSCRGQADPRAVTEYLSTIPDRWVTTHLKCGAEGTFQPTLMDNPLPYSNVLELMSENRVIWAALELLGVENKEECKENHRKSLNYLKENNLLTLN